MFFDVEVRYGPLLLLLVLERRGGRLWWALGDRHLWWHGVAPVV